MGQGGCFGWGGYRKNQKLVLRRAWREAFQAEQQKIKKGQSWGENWCILGINERGRVAGDEVGEESRGQKMQHHLVLDEEFVFYPKRKGSH